MSLGKKKTVYKFADICLLGIFCPYSNSNVTHYFIIFKVILYIRRWFYIPIIFYLFLCYIGVFKCVYIFIALLRLPCHYSINSIFARFFNIVQSLVCIDWLAHEMSLDEAKATSKGRSIWGKILDQICLQNFKFQCLSSW